VRIVTGVDAEAVAEEITARIVAAGRAYAAPHGEIDGDGS
jgi:purine nucleosidase